MIFFKNVSDILTNNKGLPYTNWTFLHHKSKNVHCYLLESLIICWMWRNVQLYTKPQRHEVTPRETKNLKRIVKDEEEIYSLVSVLILGEEYLVLALCIYEVGCIFVLYLLFIYIYNCICVLWRVQLNLLCIIVCFNDFPLF